MSFPRKSIKFLVLLFAVLWLGALVFSAMGAEPKRKDVQKKKRVLIIDPMDIRGLIQKPQSFYVDKLADISEEETKEDKNFVGLILDTAYDPVFEEETN